jgi:hypothetical protein
MVGTDTAGGSFDQIPKFGIDFRVNEYSSPFRNSRVMQHNSHDTARMQTVERPRPNSSIAVAPFIVHDDDEERLVRIAGLDPTDYLTPAEARALASALVAAVNG